MLTFEDKLMDKCFFFLFFFFTLAQKQEVKYANAQLGLMKAFSTNVLSEFKMAIYKLH